MIFLIRTAKTYQTPSLSRIHLPKNLFIVQAVMVEIEGVCALLEDITIFCPDDQ